MSFKIKRLVLFGISTDIQIELLLIPIQKDKDW